MQQIVVDVDDVNDVIAGFGAGALIRIERSTSEDFQTFGEIHTIPLVEDVTHYEWWDPSGTNDHWYRTRFSKASPVIGTDYSAYSEVVRGGGEDAYASVDDLLQMLPPSKGIRDENLLSDLLVRASAIIDIRCGRDFYRHPSVDGWEVRTFDVQGHTSFIDVAEGIVELESVEYATVNGGTFNIYSDADWTLYPRYRSPAQPYFRVKITGVGATWFYPGYSVVRLTGVFGFERPPEIIRGATLAIARDLYTALPSRSGIQSVDPNRLPLPAEAWAAVKWAETIGPPTWFA